MRKLPLIAIAGLAAVSVTSWYTVAASAKPRQQPSGSPSHLLPYCAAIAAGNGAGVPTSACFATKTEMQAWVDSQ